MRKSVWFLACLALACGGNNPPVVDDGGFPDVDDMDTSIPPVDIPNPVLVQTMAPEVVTAGELITVTCIILDENGEPYSSAGRTPQIRVSPESSVERADGMITAIRVGEVEVSCAFPDLMLTDESPAIVQIVPAAPAEVITTVDRSQVEAGETVNVTCDVFDAYGNRIEGTSPTMEVDPAEDGNTTTDLATEFTVSGQYQVSCELAGATSTSERVEVTPTLPANLVIAKVPDQPVYAIGQVIEIAAIVTDRYGNTIEDADVSFASVAPGTTLGRNRFRYDEDGTYTVTATVDPPTESGDPLTAQTTIVVNGNGPTIQCTGPRDGTMIDAVPGSTITVSGTVDDTSGVSAVMVNGSAATVDGGTFSAPLDVRFGMNFVDIIATDTFGTENSTTCTFLVSDRWAPDSSTTGDMVSLKLGMGAIDDGNRADGLDSLNDLLHTVVNSPGLRNQLHSTLLANNPLKPSSCDQSVFGICVLRSQIRYLDSQLNGPNTTSLALVNNGLQASVSLQNTRIQLRANGHVAGINYDTTGWATFSSITVNLTFDVSLSAGRPRISVRPGSVSVNVGSISTSFGGLDGAIINIIVSILNGTVRNLVSNLMRDYIEDSFNDVLDGLLSGLDISTLGSTFNVPRLDGGTIPLNFGVGFSSVSTTTARMLIGIGSRFSGPVNVAFPTLGVAIPPGTAPNPPLLDDPGLSGAQNMGVSIQSGLFNQVMHALWRGGLLDASVTGSDLGGGLPAGVSAVINGRLPPVAQITGEGVEVGIGALDLDLVYPGLFEEPIRVTLGALASTDVALAGNDLSFSAISIDELFFSTGDVSLDPATRDVLESFLRTLVQSIVDNVLNDSLPALPIPSFELPSSLTTYGLPAGTELGIRSPVLAREAQHFVLRGSFGEI